ncbi:MAG: AbrB/MazE/SpoVT family DNA-binding domain-containing protein [Firmicutes bacterium]|nr:AbrB/MazE/SpoVT family DNA-binding domain-containing protein [Bacillota bacterium]
MLRSKVTSKGQITIPSRVRERLDIEYGDEVVFDFTEDREVG